MNNSNFHKLLLENAVFFESMNNNFYNLPYGISSCLSIFQALKKLYLEKYKYSDSKLRKFLYFRKKTVLCNKFQKLFNSENVSEISNHIVGMYSTYCKL